MTDLVVEPLTADHHVQFFDCGVQSLDRWLNKEALPAHRGGLSRTHVSVHPDDEDLQVMGYYTLCPTIVTDKIPGSRGGRRDGYPSYTLCKLARHLDMVGTGHGEELIGSAMAMTALAADFAGGRFLVVDPNVKDLGPDAAEELRDFYRRYGFEDMKETNRMYMSIDTIRQQWLDR